MKVLRAYEFRCAICGYNLKLDEKNIGLEAAHIKWHQHGGPDTEDNGLALCIMHHKIFDRGAFTVSEDYRIRVSQQAHGTVGAKEWLLDFHEKPIRLPQSKIYYAKPPYLDWHHREVFKGPARG